VGQQGVATTIHVTPAAVSRKVYWQGAPGPFRQETLVSTEGNRWNAPGAPTVYLAGDLGLVLIEAGRHLAPGNVVEPRALWSARVETHGIVDLRQAHTWSDGDAADELWFLDHARARRMAARLRETDGVSGLMVPSAGSPDDLSRLNLVLFVDRLPGPLEATLREPRVIGRIDAVDSSSAASSPAPG
jgi:RES domain-containing protein